MELCLTEIAAILGSASEVPPMSVGGYSIDSRHVRGGDLFFAITGPRYDGHDFLKHAFEQGAAAAVVQASSAKLPALPPHRLVQVQNTTCALQELARAVRRKWGGKIVAITGSTGKTTTKEMTAALLAQQLHVLKSSGNLNNQYGLPLTLLKLEPSHDVAVVEMAMSGPGEIAFLASMAEPEIGVVTNVAPVHLQFFDSIDSIARAKRELIEHLQSPAVAVLNHDDERVRCFGEGFNGQIVTFGFKEGADYRALHARATQQELPAIEFEIQSGSYHQSVMIPLPGRHNVENALAAIAVASLFQISPQHVRSGFSQFHTLGQRTEILKLNDNITIINDAYNSNPCAMERMLETLASWNGAHRRVVIAGEMMELGPSSSHWHRYIGKRCAQAGAEWLIAVQGEARAILEGAIEGGFPYDRAVFFSDATQAGQFCRTLVRPGDVILVKGSRGVRLEKAIDVLLSVP